MSKVFDRVSERIESDPTYTEKDREELRGINNAVQEIVSGLVEMLADLPDRIALTVVAATGQQILAKMQAGRDPLDGPHGRDCNCGMPDEKDFVKA